MFWPKKAQFYVVFERNQSFSVPLCDKSGRILPFETEQLARNAAENTQIGALLGYRIHPVGPSSGVDEE